jgi:hypothetical protein
MSRSCRLSWTTPLDIYLVPNTIRMSIFKEQELCCRDGE